MCRIESASLVTSAIAMNSASVVDWATIDCFFERQVMTPGPTAKAYPEME
jgi:hypothetical protein